ncbi:hypothetical protein U0070_005820, partial [Myodes glareolus]
VFPRAEIAGRPQNSINVVAPEDSERTTPNYTNWRKGPNSLTADKTTIGSLPHHQPQWHQKTPRGTAINYTNCRSVLEGSLKKQLQRLPLGPVVPDGANEEGSEVKHLRMAVTTNPMD